LLEVIANLTPILLPEKLLDDYCRHCADVDSSLLTERIAGLITRELRDRTFDALTGCKSREALPFDVWCAADKAARQGTAFVESFLCCDIDDFASFHVRHGHGPADTVLIELGAELIRSGHNVYRDGGDEFVVWGRGDVLPNLGQKLGVLVRQTVVDVNLVVDRARLGRATSWIMLHLKQALTQPRPNGIRVLCRASPEWNASQG
jgi:GGDEF domain-containing protein